MRASMVLAVVLGAALARGEVAISWEEAAHHLGKEATVEGRILGVHCSKLACLLAFEPTFNRFTAVIQAERFGDFPSPEDLDREYIGREVRVHGTIRENDGKPEIVLERPEDLSLTTSARERAEEAAAEAQADILERLATVLDRIEALTERMVETEERVEAVLASLEDRADELASAQAVAAAVPPPAPEPPPRPAYERLRSIKRGMSSEEVQRLLGDPLYVEVNTTGGAVWYYGLGRSISFNDRGRAEGLAGFGN